jgi:tetratricopeptide (TPR) repeat protein
LFHILCSQYQNLVEYDSDDDGFREKSLYEIAHTYMGIGTLYDDTEDYEDSMICYNQGLEVCESLPDNTMYTKLKMDIHSCIAHCYTLQLKYQEAIKYLVDIISTTDEDNPEELIAISALYIELGRAYKNAGQYIDALNTDIKTLNLIKDILSPNDSRIATVYNNIATSYLDLGDFQNGLKFLLKSLQILNTQIDSATCTIITTLCNIGATYRKLHKYEDSMKYLKKAHELCVDKLSYDGLQIANILSEISNTYCCQNKYNDALKNETKVLKFRKKILKEGSIEFIPSFSILTWAIMITLKNISKRQLYSEKKYILQITTNWLPFILTPATCIKAWAIGELH